MKKSSWLAIWAIHVYRKWLSPLKGYHCAAGASGQRHTCSAMGLRIFKKAGFLAGGALLRRQFDRCAIAAEELGRTRNAAAKPLSGFGLKMSKQGGFVDCGGCDAPSCDAPSCDLPDVKCIDLPSCEMPSLPSCEIPSMPSCSAWSAEGASSLTPGWGWIGYCSDCGGCGGPSGGAEGAHSRAAERQRKRAERREGARASSEEDEEE